VPGFLRPPWVAAFNAAVSDVDIAAPASDAGLSVSGGEFATGVTVGDGSGETVAVTLRVAGGLLTLTDGAADDADVTVRMGRDDAVAFLAGRWAPGPALTAGRSQIRGDLSALRATGLVLEAVQPRLSGLWADTETGPPGP
jgi:hypothetical protein